MSLYQDTSYRDLPKVYLSTPSYHTYDDSKSQLVIEEEGDSTAFPEDEVELAKQNRDKVVTTHPSSLGYASITLIILNRMIGKFSGLQFL